MSWPFGGYSGIQIGAKVKSAEIDGDEWCLCYTWILMRSVNTQELAAESSAVSSPGEYKLAEASFCSWEQEHLTCVYRCFIQGVLKA